MAYANGFAGIDNRSGRLARDHALLALLLAALLAGCAGRQQHFQALAAGAETADGIRNSLVLMPLRVWPLQANLKLSGMRLVDTVTGDRHQLVFFADESLGSRALPQRKLEYEIAQTALLDMPPGRYRLAAVDLSFVHQKASANVATVALARELVLPVGRLPGYAGRLTIEVDALTVTDDFGSRRYEFPSTRRIRLYSLDVQLEVEARVRVEDRLDQDLADAIVDFPALEATVFEKTLLR